MTQSSPGKLQLSFQAQFKTEEKRKFYTGNVRFGGPASSGNLSVFLSHKPLVFRVCGHKISTVVPPASPLPSPQVISIILHLKIFFRDSFFKATK